MENKRFEIGSLFSGGRVPLALAPMAGVTDRVMRAICIEHGADLVTTEMVSAKAVHYKDKKTAELALLSDSERPAAIQIFGSDPAIMAESAAELFDRFRPEMIDINMGCPVAKVVKSGDGSALMRDPALAGRIVRAVTDAAPCPVSVKFRAGWDKDSVNAPEFARVLEANGASLLCIHGRTKTQMYAPPVDLDVIRETVNAVSVPVFGNGGVNTPDDAVKMLGYTGCAGLAIARGACGSPWIFAAVRARLDGREYIPPSPSERIAAALRHFDALVAWLGQKAGVREARKHLGWYLFGLRGAASARLRINAAEDPDEVRSILGQIEEASRQ